MSERFVHLFVGTYGSASDGGIHEFRMDTEEGTLERYGGVSGIENASFLALSRDGTKLFAVSETMEGEVVSYRVDLHTKALQEISRQPTYGAHPCFLMPDASERWLLLVNYSTGKVCVYPILEDGGIGEVTDQIQHEGRSIRDDRQKEAHPHSIYSIPGTNLWLVPDLGNDSVYTYKLDTERGKLIQFIQTKVKPGAGPRHLALHPTKPFVYVIEELSSSISVFKLDPADGALTYLQTETTLPNDFSGESTCAEIVVSADGLNVYGSNRGHDSIASFRVREDGLLQSIGFTSSGGVKPRNFVLAPGGKFIIVANQDSDSLVILRRNEDGSLESTGNQYTVSKPVCVKAYFA